jgi:Zn-dependent protease with chaperone function
VVAEASVISKVTGVMSDLWWTLIPLIVLPLVACLLSRVWLALHTTPRLPGAAVNARMPSGLAAAAAASVPGATFLAVGVTQTFLVLGHPTTSVALFVSHYAATVIVLASLFWASSWLFWHQLTTCRLMSAAKTPSSRLERIGSRSGVRVLELPTPHPVCMLVGMFQPVALVSAGALARLDDEFLGAALLHERAHAKHRDPLISAIVEFFCALVFFVPTGCVNNAYRKLREVNADRDAAAATDPTSVAAALIALARVRSGPQTACGLIELNDLRERLSLLLEEPVPSAPVSAATLPQSVLGLAFDFGLTLYPLAASAAASAIVCARWYAGS